MGPATSTVCLGLLLSCGDGGGTAMAQGGADGVTKDRQAACDSFAVSERRSDPKGTELLADCYFHGDGRPQSYVQSAVLYARAAARGADDAYCALGKQYLQGLGVTKDPGKAVSLCQVSAERGVADAQAELGQFYLQGAGVERDPSRAMYWLRKAADQGHAKAALVLGTMYWNGDGVERSHEQAAKFWHIAARHVDRSAPALLGKYYFTLAIVPAQQRVNEEAATEAIYWSTVATMVDPDIVARANSQKIADMLLHLAPGLKPRVQAMLASAHGTEP